MRRRACPTDLTDAQWAAISGLVPDALPGGRPRRANWSTRSSACCAAAKPGACCPTTSRPGRPSAAACGAGRPQACGNASTMPCWWPTANGQDATPAPLRRSSAANRFAPAIKRGLARLRRGQEDRGAQAPHPDRHRRPPARSSAACRQRPGPRWSQAPAACLPTPSDLRGNRVRRWRIHREACGVGEGEGQPHPVHRQAPPSLAARRAAAMPMGHCTARGLLERRLHDAARLKVVSRRAARASLGLRVPFVPISHRAL